MQIEDIECPECGAHAMEVPEPNGDTRCAMCGHEINLDDLKYTKTHPRFFED